MINATPIRPLSTTPVSGTNTTPSPASTTTENQSASQNTSNTGNPSSISPKKKGVSLKYILAGLFLLLLLVGGGAGLYLMRMNQDVRQQAYGGGCTTAGATQCVGGKKEVCDGSTWRPSNESCTDGVTCSSAGQKPTDTGKGCCSGLSIDATGRCVTVVATPTPAGSPSSCNPDTHCCNPSGCVRWVK